MNPTLDVLISSKIKKITTYETEDGEKFNDISDAETHIKELIVEKSLNEKTDKVKKLFGPELKAFKKKVKELDVDLETDFWDEERGLLANHADVDTTIYNFNDYVQLVSALLNYCHLKATIEIIEKHNSITH